MQLCKLALYYLLSRVSASSATAVCKQLPANVINSLQLLCLQEVAGRRRGLLYFSRSLAETSAKLNIIITLADSVTTATQVTEATKTLISALGIADSDVLSPNATLSDLVTVLNQVTEQNSNAASALTDVINNALVATGINATITATGGCVATLSWAID